MLQRPGNQLEKPMKKSLIGMAVVVSILVPAAALAQPAEPSVPVSAARTSYALGAGEFAGYATTYALKNGQVVQFAQRGNHYFVQLKSSARALHREDATGQQYVSTRLRPIGPGTFVTDGGAELTFAQDGEELRISHFERLPEARVAAAQTNVMMVARR
jgi:hypothetical protein